MPSRNRVTPFGEIVAVPERGRFFGNRGVLHDGEGRLRKDWQVKRWLVCLLEFRGRWRPIVTPNHYTGLYFLDEATALAAGHRPCAECRRDRFVAFRDAWMSGTGSIAGPGPIRVAAIDDRLHAERINPDGSKHTEWVALDDLPDGVLVVREGRAWLIAGDRLRAWSPGGYGESIARPGGEVVAVLTPRSTVAVIRAGYFPEIHPSAAGPPGEGAGPSRVATPGSATESLSSRT